MDAHPQSVSTESGNCTSDTATTRQFQAVLDAATEIAIIATDPDGLITIFNRGAEKMLGYSADEMVGKQSPMPLHLAAEVEQRGIELSGKMGKEISGFRVFVESSRVSGVEKRDWTYVRKDGSHLQASLTVTIIRDDQGAVTGFLGIAEDLTERIQAEQERDKLVQELQLAQRMESTGRLASGVSHDLNNLLTPILGYAEMLRIACASDDRLLKRIHGILEAAGKARELNRQLLAFSRNQVMEMKAIDLNQVITCFCTLLEQTIRPDIGISLKLDPRLGRIKADRVQIEQIIMNLAINAQDAMPSGGALIIETSNISLSSATKPAPDLKPGPHVVLSFTDSGLGMSPETICHIFEPFFTTKAPGKGTGLGLATVFGIAKQHGGHACAVSEPGCGSTFTIFFPRLEDAAETGTGGEQSGTRTQHGRRTILLVEDNPLVREMTCELLTEHGYTVLTAAGAQEATALMVKHPQNVDLLLTDMNLPGMGGNELFETIKPLNPALKVIFLSGYNDTAVARQTLDECSHRCVYKPFTHDAILNVIDEVLADRQG